MVWVPDEEWNQQKGKGSKGVISLPGKGWQSENKGKGWQPEGKGWQPEGKGKGWQPAWQPAWQPQFEKAPWDKGKGKGKGKGQGLKVDPSLKVWIGNLPDGVTWKDVQTHMNQAGATKWVEAFGGKSKGTAAVVYSTAEEATNAISMLNGTVLADAAIICDAWEQKPKEAAA